ncbi:polyprenyl synthetase [Algimonas ampicilliniresistens]|uniref:Polyprenyl synthetase n=1 Tax=Algimonas ampicilliniresistens TaxID=1298735 RepID=A0ABQ5V7Q5_9PROT|nr:polyprenyl synthetase family protein [Algimonas ampicilliniresistens]GLQ23042.1 polyprenyl synthetase [Algimonas ampicilliniresistens]
MTAPAQIQQDDALSPAQQLWTISADDMGAVDAIILERMHSPVGMIPDLAQHLVGAGGKRLRPLLTVATARLCGYKGEAHHKLAAAVEFIHSATLLHDDVVDESDLRRGKKPANLIWGNSASILVGDFLFARAFNLMVETGSMEALGILSNAASVIAEGEVQQLASLRNLAMSEADYMDVIKAKTAALFAAATEVSPVIAGLDDTRRAALRDYGLKLGLAFQLIDDALDYGGQQAALGKSVGDDFREGKMTLPVIRALAKADATERDFWRKVVVDRDQDDLDLQRAVSILRKSGALDETIQMARRFSVEAIEALDIFEESPLRDCLQNLAAYVVSRAS